jgi:nucleotidyltransferase substrate binding protein (TIGR01987 family)
MKDFLKGKGITDILGSRDSIRHAFDNALIANAQLWMFMLKDRNDTTHGYDENMANDIAEQVRHDFYPAFLAFTQRMEGLQ